MGYNDAGTITGSYWDTQTSGQLTSSGGTGLSTAQMMQLATFSTGWDIDDEGGTGKTWRIYEGNTYPLLRHFLTAATATVDNASMGYNGSTTVAGGSHTWDIAVDAAKIFGVAAYTSASKNVGAQAVTLTGLYSKQQGYDIKTVDGTVDIAKAVLTITAQTNTKTYDGTKLASATPICTGLQAGDTVTGLTEAYDTKNAGTGKTLTVTGYTVNDGNSGNNYAVATENNTTGVINKLALTGSIAEGTSSYGSALNPGAVILTNKVEGDVLTTTASVNTTGNTSTSGNLKAGSYNGIEYISALEGADAGNYTFADVKGNYTVSQLPLTGSIAEGTSSYGSALNPGAVILTNKVEGDVLTTTASVNTTGNTSTSGNLKAGSYNGIEYISALEGADAGNYTFADIEGDYTVSQLALTGTAIASGTSTYGSALNPGAVSFWNVVGTDVVTSTAAVDTGATSTSGNYVAGTYTQTASAIDGADASNYSFGGFTSAANYTITARSLTAAYTGTNKFYDATTAATATGSSNDIIAGDAVTFSQTAAFADKNVATGKTVSVSGIALSGADAANYSLTGTTATTTADINPAALTVTAKDDHKIYSGVGYSGGNGVTYDGFVGGETSAVLGGALTYGGTSQGAVHTGTYGIDPQGLTSGNYDVSFVGGVLTIVRSQTILIDIYAALMSTKEILSIPPTAGSATLANLTATTLIKDNTEGK
ncbi:MAG TPA: YDG domain-containing protein [Syntrophales bacterium]|nr:YDG domain-containing protein [Syntrophales bacterium]